MLNTLDKKRMTKICKDSSNKIKFPWYSHSFDDLGCLHKCFSAIHSRNLSKTVLGVW